MPPFSVARPFPVARVFFRLQAPVALLFHFSIQAIFVICYTTSVSAGLHFHGEIEAGHVGLSLSLMLRGA
jgi:hypothetical protein